MEELIKKLNKFIISGVFSTIFYLLGLVFLILYLIALVKVLNPNPYEINNYKHYKGENKLDSYQYLNIYAVIFIFSFLTHICLLVFRSVSLRNLNCKDENIKKNIKKGINRSMFLTGMYLIYVVNLEKKKIRENKEDLEDELFDPFI